MSIATLTSKGQITIPKKVRDRLGLEAGDRVIFRLRPDGILEMTPEQGDILSLQGILKPKRRGVTLAEMDDVIRKVR